MSKILVVDDAEYILETTAAILRYEGHEVEIADNGKTAFSIAIQFMPDLILSDISMPEMDGYQFLEKIRYENSLNSTHFIFLTAFADKTNIRLGMEKGADDYLIKPFSRDELVAAINAQFKKHQKVEQQLEEKVTRLGKSIITILPHEFRTVLNQISGTAKFINVNYRTVNHEELVELTQDIISSSERLLKITENYLIYARLESLAYSNTKRLVLRSFKTDEPTALVHDISQIIADRFARLDDLEVYGTFNDIYLEVSTDSFHKILNELIENAFYFSEKGTKVIISASYKNDSFIEFKIKDYGRGMSEEHIASIGAMIQFERDIYEQQGVGLGLTISKKIVEMHDGEFTTESKVGIGTEITFTLPYKRN